MPALSATTLSGPRQQNRRRIDHRAVVTLACASSLCIELKSDSCRARLSSPSYGFNRQPARVVRILVAWFVFPNAVAMLAPTTATATKPPVPNILLILADDLGFSDIGCYGGEIATPHLDALAAKGLRHTQFYNTARCWPTRAALMTGYYAQQVRRDTMPGVRGGGQGKRPLWARLLPQRLAEAGYRSYHSGKWHIDQSPQAGGFDRSYEVTDHDRFFRPRSQKIDGRTLPPVAENDGYYTSTAISDFAIRCLAEHFRDHGERPFFAYVAFTAPHFPLQAPPADIARYQHVYDMGWDRIRSDRWRRLRNLACWIAGSRSWNPRSVPPTNFLTPSPN